MPKKKKKKQSKKRTAKKRKNKTRKKTSKIRKIKSKTKNIKKNQDKNSSSSELVFKTKAEWIKNSLANKTQYQKKYSDSIKNNNAFWKKEGKRITWIKPYKKIKDIKYSKDEV